MYVRLQPHHTHADNVCITHSGYGRKRIVDELNEILAETQKEEEALIAKAAEFEKQIEDRLVTAYKRIRTSVKNGLAVVPIERGASGGSFFTIPPQVQMEIASRRKIITDEHSGRILIDEQLAEEEKEKMNQLFASF